MSDNLPVLSFAQPGSALSLPPEIAQSFAALYEEAFAGFAGAGLRRIKTRKMDFLLIDGQNQEVVPPDQLIGVFLGSAPHNHAVWYEKDFAPGQEPEAPDLTWVMPTPGTFPPALPLQFQKKVLRNGQERWAFQILRRVAFALVRNINGQSILDLEHPYVMDLSSMSLFGKGLPDQNMYKWGGIRDVCAQHSMPGLLIMPSMFMIQIVIDPNATVNGVVLFRPMRNQTTGQLQFLDPSIIQKVHECAMKQSTRDMLVIREKLDYGPHTQVGAPQSTILPPPGQAIDPSLLQSVAPMAPAQPAPTQLQMPQPVATPPVQDAAMSSLLAQAQAVLNQRTAAAPVAPPTSVPPVQPAAQVVQPVAAPLDPTVQSSINSLLSQLG